MKFPGHIYFDTNILRKLRKEIDTPEYQVLKKIAKDLDIVIAIPELVIKEWINYHIEDRVKANIREVEILERKLKNYALSEEDVTININKDKILKDLEKYLLGRLEAEEIRVIKTPRIEMDMLIDRAVRKISPFIIIKSPVGLPGRAIRNKFLRELETKERLEIRCPYRCLSTCNVLEAKYCIAQALVNAYLGDIDHGLIFCGQNAYRINKIVTVKELISELVAEIEAY